MKMTLLFLHYGNSWPLAVRPVEGQTGNLSVPQSRPRCINLVASREISQATRCLLQTDVCLK